MSRSAVAFAPGERARATKLESLRNDAIGLIESGVAGEAIAGKYAVVLKSDNRWYYFRDNENNVGRQIGVTTAAAAGAGSVITVYRPGYIIDLGVSIFTVGQKVYPQSTGALTTSGPSWSVSSLDDWNLQGDFAWGEAISTSAFLFDPQYLDWDRDTILMRSGEAWSATTTLGGVTAPTLLYKKGDGLLYRARGNTYALGDIEGGGSEGNLYMAFQASGGAGGVVRVYRPGAIVLCTGLSMNAEYYADFTTPGAINTGGTNRYGYTRKVGTPISTKKLLFNPGDSNRLQVSNLVTASTVIAVRDLCYLNKVTNKWAPASKGSAPNGTCEVYGFALTPAAGDNALFNIATTPGMLVNGFTGLTPGAVYAPSSTPGVLQDISTITPFNFFFRPVCFATSSSDIVIIAEPRDYMPAGRQEKGFCGASNTSNGTNAGIIVGCGVNFKKVMENTPTSITFTASITSGFTTGPFSYDITRFGFRFSVYRTTAGDYTWGGYYDTVGN